MGVPAFFRWLSGKYSDLVVSVVEETPKRTAEGETVPVDSSKPNPNGMEFDNLYLDMNGIIHPCTHPEDKPAPKNEDEMMVAIFEYIDRLFAIVRPRRVLYMAIDGVAPRAKMNQQRSRRFRAAKDHTDKVEAIEEMKQELLSNGIPLPPEKEKAARFDHNCITPGTHFMQRLSERLRFYIHDRMNNDEAWANIAVILSDANVPGEGEHKLIDFIRKQRAQPDHDPNTKHVLCGADADLIMLGLATHEPHFTIIREEFKPGFKPPKCDICGETGHEFQDCQGDLNHEADKNKGHNVAEETSYEQVNFIFIRINALREYLDVEFKMDCVGFKWDLENVIDDWVFMCFFVGNDFLPHMPSLEIREGAIDRLVGIYKRVIKEAKGYLTTDGFVDLGKVKMVVTSLGDMEDQIFKRRREDEQKRKQAALNRRNRELDMKRQKLSSSDVEKLNISRHFQKSENQSSLTNLAAPRPDVAKPSPAVDDKPPDQETFKKITALANDAAANSIRDSLMKDRLSRKGKKRAAPSSVDEARFGVHESEEVADKKEAEAVSRLAQTRKMADISVDPEDSVRLWEDGWRVRYYQSKFGIETSNVKEIDAFAKNVALEYLRGMCWVLRYYYQGCCSWDWYYPYHYAPFASDMVYACGDALTQVFPTNTKPFKPLEQLMAVFPAASRTFLPPSWQPLMYEPDSPIIDQYPIDFKIDLNGKRFAWQGVALLPFVNEKALLSALQSVYHDLTEDEKDRNALGPALLFISRNKQEDLYQHIEEVVYKDTVVDDSSDPVLLAGQFFHGIRARLKPTPRFRLERGATFVSPLPSYMADVERNQVTVVAFDDPEYATRHKFSAKLLPNVKMPKTCVDRFKFANQSRGRGGYRGGGGGNRAGLGHRGRGYSNQGGNFPPRDNREHVQFGMTPNAIPHRYTDVGAAARTLHHALPGMPPQQHALPGMPPQHQGYNNQHQHGGYQHNNSQNHSNYYDNHQNNHHQGPQQYYTSNYQSRGGYRGRGASHHNRGGYQR